MQVVPFADSTPLIEDPDRLRCRAEADGFLFFSGLLDKELVCSAAHSVLEYASRVGWLDSRAPMSQGRVAAGRRVGDSKDPDWVGLQVHLQPQPAVHALGKASAILQVVGAAAGSAGEAALSMANICRIFSPHPDLATPPHQDGHFLGALGHFWTAWVPLTDCELELGPIAILPGSHRWGLWSHSAEGVARDDIHMTATSQWQSADVHYGDLVLFGPQTVHCALPNLSKDRLRMSMDFRYVFNSVS